MIRIEPLSKRHDLKSFDCGNDDLNAYLKKTVRQHQEKGISRTFVLTEDTEPTTILGFYTLIACEVRTDALPSRFAKKYPPQAAGAKLARLAISKNKQRQRPGKQMMVDAVQRVVVVSESVGIIGFFVDAKNQQANRYYKQYGFIELPDNPLQMFLPLATLLQAFSEAI